MLIIYSNKNFDYSANKKIGTHSDQTKINFPIRCFYFNRMAIVVKLMFLY